MLELTIEYLKVAAWVLAALVAVLLRNRVRGGSFAWNSLALSCLIVGTRRVIKDVPFLIGLLPIQGYIEYYANSIGAILWALAISLIFLAIREPSKLKRDLWRRIIIIITVVVMLGSLVTSSYLITEDIALGRMEKHRGAKIQQSVLWTFAYGLTFILLLLVFATGSLTIEKPIFERAFQILIVAAIFGLIWKGSSAYKDIYDIKLALPLDIGKKITEIFTAFFTFLGLQTIYRSLTRLERT